MEHAGSSQSVSPEDPSDRIFESVKNEYLATALEQVRSKAKEIAARDGRQSINHVDTVKAFEEQFHAKLAVRKQSWYRENAFLLIVVTMTLVFGAMGLLPYFLSPADPQRFGFKPDAFLDMAKLFAGVIVGGAAGATAATSLTTVQRIKG